MRRINHFQAKGGVLVSVINSITKEKSSTSYCCSSSLLRFWVPWEDGSLRPSYVYMLEDNEALPEPQVGWAYAFGFFG